MLKQLSSITHAPESVMIANTGNYTVTLYKCAPVRAGAYSGSVYKHRNIILFVLWIKKQFN